MVPPLVDKQGLPQRWCRACPASTVSGLSGHIPGADHILSGPEAHGMVVTTSRRLVELLKSDVG
ncbi:hypothetical protein LZ32DRAFT_607454 [Colletotrichum eremochloae]|nr:hypothetical protein LZ32DRAFT_607454 [Colletotrichum eremochloae]